MLSGPEMLFVLRPNALDARYVFFRADYHFPIVQFDQMGDRCVRGGCNWRTTTKKKPPARCLTAELFTVHTLFQSRPSNREKKCLALQSIIFKDERCQLLYQSVDVLS